MICDVAKDQKRSIGCLEWSVTFSHLAKDYIWELKTSSSAEDPFSELGDSEIVYEKLTEIKNNQEVEILNRTEELFQLDSKNLPKLKKTESAITLLGEEDSIKPVIEAFKRFVFNETPQQFFISMPFDPNDFELSLDGASEYSNIDQFKEEFCSVLFYSKSASLRPASFIIPLRVPIGKSRFP